MSHQHAGKKPYRSVAHAIVDARMVSMHTGETCIAYPCEFCSDWHVGHYQQLRTQIGVAHPGLADRLASRLSEPEFAGDGTS